ncbi:hypothetical protein QQZ08_000353 [Neonectria magnoliae]|uniref:Beta-lactamase-related domain-containing protein n=1 Tax=Neonectria magnoliae TaxID=2732573 RepID=A0ABR1IGW1_9HYPO
MEKLQALVDEAVQQGSPTYVSPSVAAVVVGRNGKVLFQRSSGILRNNLPLPDEAVWWMASQTKLVTTIAAMQTVEQGLIGLDDDVLEWLPELSSLEVLDGTEDEHAVPQVRPRTNKITLRYV